MVISGILKRYQRALTSGLAASAILAVLSVASYWSLGSLEAGVSYLRGNRLFLDQHTRDLGIVDAGTHEVAFRVKNLSSQPVQIVGAKTSCSCVVAEDLPVTIEPSASLLLRIRVQIDDRRGSRYSQTMQLITDRGVEPAMAVTMLATVRPRAVKLPPSDGGS